MATTHPKVDFKKTLAHLYAPSRKEWELIEVPARWFVMADGHGDPNASEEYVAVVEALYALSYALKFFSKKELGRDYVVAPLEGLWWAKDMDVFASRDKSAWDWTMLIPQPDWLTEREVEAQREAVRAKKNPTALDRVRFESFEEGLCLQRLHVGSYEDESTVLRQLHEEVMPARGLGFAGKHHEIYLSDPRRVAAEKLKTVLRQPVRAL